MNETGVRQFGDVGSAINALKQFTIWSRSSNRPVGQNITYPKVRLSNDAWKISQNAHAAMALPVTPVRIFCARYANASSLSIE